jgi:hypothetical protein
MRFFLKSLAVLAIGAVLGLAVTWLAVFRSTGGTGDGIDDGPWHTSLLVGSTQSGMLLRAVIAVHGLLALNRSETIYYTATTDGAGAKFDSRCTYKIAGSDPPTRWWSITAYGADDFLIPNPAKLYSASKNSVTRATDGSFVVIVSRSDSGPNGIPVGDGPFSLSLRLYNPDAKVAADPAHVKLPTIAKEKCT